MRIQTKRIYDSPAGDDGFRVLVDRLWPRGVTKHAARIDRWAKELAPTTNLRKWFSHDESRFSEFRSRYLKELDQKRDFVRQIIREAKGRTITLLFGARDRTRNHAVVLQEFLSQE